MASFLGTSVPLDCPACDEPMTIPVKEIGREGATLTVALNLAPFREHIAAAHQGVGEESREAMTGES